MRRWRPTAPVFAPVLGFFLLVLLSGAGSVSFFAPSLLAGEMPQARVRIAGVEFTVDVADTPALQSRGLGGRKTLGAREGMLFLYAQRGKPTFWMYGMVIPIDIIWIDNTRIVHIEHWVPPPAPGTPRNRLPTYRPDRPANAVLEIAAGLAAKLDLRVGARVDINFDVQ